MPQAEWLAVRLTAPPPPCPGLAGDSQTPLQRRERGLRGSIAYHFLFSRGVFGSLVPLAQLMEIEVGKGIFFNDVLPKGTRGAFYSFASL